MDTNTIIDTEIFSDIFNPTFWNKEQISLFHSENNIIIIGTDNLQLQVNFVPFEDSYIPLIKESKPTEKITLLNIKLCGLSLKFSNNKIKFKNILKDYFTKSTVIELDKSHLSLYLNNNTITYKYPINFDILKSETKDNIIYSSCESLKLLVGKINPKNAIINEIKAFNSDLSFPHFIELFDDNIFKLKLHLFKSKTLKAIILFNLDSRYFPLVPPKIKWISPVIIKDVYAAIINAPIFNNKWNPIIDFKWIATNLLKNLIDKENTLGTIIFSDEQNLYTNEDKTVINFLKTLGSFTTKNPLSIEFNKTDIKLSNNNFWKKGTGYSYSGLSRWSLDNYLQKQTKIESKIIKYLEQLILFDTLSTENFNLILDNCLIEVRGTTFMDIQHNTQLYIKYFTFIKKYYSKDFKCEYIKTIYENFNDIINSIDISESTSCELAIIKDILQQINKLIFFENKSEQSQQKSYCQIMKPLQFNYNDITNVKYTFSKMDGKPSSTKHIMRIAQEISSVKKSLPLNEESSIWVRWDKNQLNKMQFMISGPKDTPYQDGLFLFDTYFPTNYPKIPPKIILQTTGRGTVRFNPNLYYCGKVCLSLLGTWNSESQGEQWNEKTSTILQVLVSIQSLILIEQPYFNEPGYEKTIGTSKGNEASEKYNQNIRQSTAKWAIQDIIENPPSGFEDIVKQHFLLKKDKLINMLEDWKNKDNKICYQDAIISSIKTIQKL